MKRILLTLFLASFSFTTFAQVKNVVGNYLPGYYIGKDGTQVTGLVRHSYGNTWGDVPDNFIDFKLTPEAREQRLTVQEITGFVLGQDSFTVKQNFDITPHDHYTQDFVRVVKTGKISLYLHYSTVTTQVRRNVLTYLLEKDGEMYRMVRPANFTEQLPILVADNKEILRKIKTKEYKFEHLQTIIEEYNQWYAQKEAKL